MGTGMRLAFGWILLFSLCSCGDDPPMTTGLCASAYVGVAACGGDGEAAELGCNYLQDAPYDDPDEQALYECYANLECEGTDAENLAELDACGGAHLSVGVRPRDLSATHEYGTSPCPQEIGTVTVTNFRTIPQDVVVANPGGIAVSFDPFTLTLGPGESSEVVVYFECDPNGISGTVQVAGIDVDVDVVVNGAP